jgi:hypothetical protein
MAALDEIYGWTGFDEEQNLRGFLDLEKIGDGLLGAVVEEMEIFAVQSANELSARIGDDDSDVNAVDTDANVGRRRDGLLRNGGRHKQEGAGNENGAAVRGRKHASICHRRMAARKTEALSRLEFPESGTGLAIFTQRKPTLG